MATSASPPDGRLLEWIAAAGLPEEAEIALLLPAVAASCSGCAAHRKAVEEALRALAPSEREASRWVWTLAALGAVNPRRCLQDEFREARKVRRALGKRPPGKRAAAARRGRQRYRNPAVVLVILEEAQKAVRSNPAGALAWLAAAGEIVPFLTAAGYDEAVAAGLGVRVAAHQANAHRVAGDLVAADELFQSFRHDPRRHQVLDLAIHAEVASFEASLRQDQRRFRAAEGLRRKAARLFASVGNTQGQAKVLIQRGILLDLQGDSKLAIECYQSALAVLNPRRDGRLALMAKNNLALALCGLGDFQGAAAAVAEARPLYRRFAEPWTLIRQAWLEGRIARGLDDGDAAERHFRRSLQMSLDAGNGFDAALVGLDLAELYLAQGRTGAVKDLAGQLAAAFHLRGVHSEMVKALRLFERAAAAEQVTAALVQALREYLRRAEHDPALAFRAGG